MSAFDEPPDSPNGTTSQLVLGLLLANLLAVLGAIAFTPASGANGIEDDTLLVLAVGVMSLLSAALLFMFSTLRRHSAAWWVVNVAVNVTQVLRLVPAVIAIAARNNDSQVGAAVWAFGFVPFLGLLAGLGLVTTVRAARRRRRSQFSHAA